MVKIRIGNTSWDIDENTANFLRENIENLNAIMNFWTKHNEYWNKTEKKTIGRPPFICLIRDAINEIDKATFRNMPKSCAKWREDLIRKANIQKSRGNTRLLERIESLAYINLHDPMVRYCIEEYISKRLDMLSGSLQDGRIINGRIVKKYTRNKYRLTTGSLRRAKILYKNPYSDEVINIDCSRWVIPSRRNTTTRRRK